MSITPFQKAVYTAVRKIPRGKITTYAKIARAIGKPRATRAVGNALNKNPFSPQVPCHRVVRSDLTIGGFARGTKVKIALLRREGVKVKKGVVSPAKCSTGAFRLFLEHGLGGRGGS